MGARAESARSTCTVYTDKTSGKWYYVEYNGVTGWAYSSYIPLL